MMFQKNSLAKNLKLANETLMLVVESLTFLKFEFEDQDQSLCTKLLDHTDSQDFDSWTQNKKCFFCFSKASSKSFFETLIEEIKPPVIEMKRFESQINCIGQ